MNDNIARDKNQMHADKRISSSALQSFQIFPWRKDFSMSVSQLLLLNLDTRCRQALTPLSSSRPSHASRLRVGSSQKRFQADGLSNLVAATLR
jgi:hypothetical protein